MKVVVQLFVCGSHAATELVTSWILSVVEGFFAGQLVTTLQLALTDC